MSDEVHESPSLQAHPASDKVLGGHITIFQVVISFAEINDRAGGWINEVATGIHAD